jgi:hypothetical protein
VRLLSYLLSWLFILSLSSLAAYASYLVCSTTSTQLSTQHPWLAPMFPEEITHPGFHAVLTMRRLGTSMVIAMCSENQGVQMGLMLVGTAGYLWYLVKVRPCGVGNMRALINEGMVYACRMQMAVKSSM